MSELPFDNSHALLVDMDLARHLQACVLTAFAMRNIIHEQMQRYPDRFIGFCDSVDTACAEWSGEAEFDPQKAAGEVNFWLSNGLTRVGALFGMLPDKKHRLSIDENMYPLCPS